MAPEHSINTGNLWLEANRHSSRLFNKNATKLDISAVNNKIDFMKSLDLLCINNTKESTSKVNWEVLLPKNSLPLKKCSVVISDMKCDICGQLLKNQMEMEHHKTLHRNSTGEDFKNMHSSKVIKEKHILSNFIKTSTQQNYIECNNNNNNNNNNNIINNENKMKACKKSTHRRSKDGLTKVTLKIGGEVISKVYCKKKYLTKVRTKKLKVSGFNSHEGCQNCNEIENVLRNNKVNASIIQVSSCQTKSCDTEQTNRNIARLRKMAAVLVEHELQRKALRSLGQSDFLSDEDEVFNQSGNEDAIVPELNSESIDSVDLGEDDEIQEILRIKRDVSKLSDKNFNSRFLTDHQRSRFSTTKDCEIITIDDEICDNFEDDCVIIDERSSDQNCLRDQENSYIFHISSENSFNVNTSDTESMQVVSEKRKSLSNSLSEDESLLKKRKAENMFDFHYTENLSTREIEKENRNCQGPAIKLSQIALPLRLINF